MESTGDEVFESKAILNYVEQDTCERPLLESIRISYDYLKNLKVWRSEYPGVAGPVRTRLRYAR